MPEALQFRYKKLESFGFVFFVGNLMMRVYLRIFAEVTGPWAPIRLANFLTQVCIRNQVIIRLIRALDCLSSISGSKIMAAKPKYW